MTKAEQTALRAHAKALRSTIERLQIEHMYLIRVSAERHVGHDVRVKAGHIDIKCGTGAISSSPSMLDVRVMFRIDGVSEDDPPVRILTLVGEYSVRYAVNGKALRAKEIATFVQDNPIHSVWPYAKS